MINNQITRSVLSSVGYDEPRASFWKARLHLERLGYMISITYRDGLWYAMCEKGGRQIPYKNEGQRVSTAALGQIIDYLCLNGHVNTDN